MTLPFCEEIINDGEITQDNFHYPNFVGFLNSKGEPIDYSMPFGCGGHDNNPTTDLFKYLFIIRYREYKKENWISHSEYKGEENEKRICQQKRPYIDKKLNDINDDIIFNLKHKIKVNQFKLMKRDLLEFFKNCYSNDTFNKGLGKYIRFMDRCEFNDKIYYSVYQKLLKLYPYRDGESYDQYNYRIPKFYDFEFQYRHYTDTELLDLLKEVFVCYMGYHSVERIPRTITTSVPNIYETFYNYFLHDFNIVQLPRMIFDDSKRMYIEHPINNFFIPDSALRLKAELQSVKKLVPLDQRYKYHR